MRDEQLLDDIDGLHQEIRELQELHRMQLAAIAASAMLNTREALAKHRIDRSNVYWTPALEAVYAAMEREIALLEGRA
jgi:hypothetical protein